MHHKFPLFFFHLLDYNNCASCLKLELSYKTFSLQLHTGKVSLCSSRRSMVVKKTDDVLFEPFSIWALVSLCVGIKLNSFWDGCFQKMVQKCERKATLQECLIIKMAIELCFPTLQRQLEQRKKDPKESPFMIHPHNSSCPLLLREEPYSWQKKSHIAYQSI